MSAARRQPARAWRRRRPWVAGEVAAVGALRGDELDDGDRGARGTEREALRRDAVQQRRRLGRADDTAATGRGLLAAPATRDDDGDDDDDRGDRERGAE